jgi:hypothetical protein
MIFRADVAKGMGPNDASSFADLCCNHNDLAVFTLRATLNLYKVTPSFS